MTVSAAEAAPQSPPISPTTVRITSAAALITAAKIFGGASGFVTGPLLAHALGARGRGDLAAIIVPFTLLQGLLGLGIPAYPYLAIPRGSPAREVIGSLGLPLLAIGMVAVLVAVPVADLLAAGRVEVRTWLIVALCCAPLVLLQNLFSSCLAALGRWRAVALSIAIPFAVPLVGITALYVSDKLTVSSAAAITIAASILSILPAVPMLRSIGPPVFRRSISVRGVSVGTKAWMGGVAQMANLRLDQVLMIAVVPSRVLGLYAVATTLASAPTFAVSGLVQPLMARIARGETDLMPRGVRVALALALVINGTLALIAPTILTLLFGEQFRAAVPMALILLVSTIPFCGAMVLSSALFADGAPVIPTIGELLALAVTVAGLALLLGPLGGIGAAIVSVAAYSTTFIYQLIMARRRTGFPLRMFVLPNRSDARWALDLSERTIRKASMGRVGFR